MKVSYNWLQEHIDFDYSPEELAHELTMVGLEVEAVEELGAEIKDVVVGQVKEINEHQNADKLSVCKVDIGNKVSQIVCGADNMSEGDKVPVAPVGMEMPDGMKIEEVELRGVKSSGMMCSTNELNLPDDGVDGLYILDQDLKVGNQLIKEIELDDVILEFDLTPNYAHCLSIIGVAREVAAITNNELHLPEVDLEETEEEVDDVIDVTVKDSDLAPRYAGRVIKNVEVKESPDWLKNRLEAVGIGSVNNIVDITNYILMELGQPLHAFDYDKLEGQEIIVRRAKEGEKLLTLDEEERDLDEDMLVIADADKPVCIGGVMGGANSEVTEETTTLFLESANFAPSSVRKTSKKLKIPSDSSHRFERGVDINGVEYALNRAAELIAEIGDGDVLKGYKDVYPEELKPQEIIVRPQRVREILGLELAKIKIKSYLERLHFDIEDKGVNLLVKVPTYRVDVNKEIDLIEEIARIYGYDKVEPTQARVELKQGKKNWKQKVEAKTKELLTDLGIFEVQNYSFINESEFDKLNLAEDNWLRNIVEINNPVNEEHTIMRTTLLPSLLENISLNVNRGVEDLSIFELNTVFLPQSNSELPEERLKLSFAVMKDELKDSWEVNAAGFFYLKGIIENYCKQIGIVDLQFVEGEFSALHPGRTAEIVIEGKSCGYLGELHPDVQENYDLSERVTVCELDFETIVNAATANREYQPLPKYPALSRDIALVVDNEVTSKEIKDLILKVGSDVIESIKLFDLYQGEQLENGDKSLAYSIKYRVADRTLTDEEVNQVQSEIEEKLNQELVAHIRR
ncbi:phenylalanine--tRNA ligase subunit beta [Halanaerobacter jeridensis]|uniref:Phenylalanine--tRNA ligase beta subunit n=1 Tax=Halanaerobacter jeridensis TaxID=706427 RepID=A0A938XYJ9_9FIRM|nr:phenylalanine--tRNA ligase subunit beta [Halanaerobacter jeridensis]MBM7558062.1 phenylalanyl-tRNA synthetase beta chain [Halanaerobacter jeridensis]